MAVMRDAPRAAPSSIGQIDSSHGKLTPGPGRAASEVAAHQRARIHHALIEIVAERGYAAVKVRDLVEAAGVSTRAFYEHFDGKEDCFLRTYEVVTRRGTRRIVSAQAGADDWRERPRLVLDEFIRGLERHPRTARFVLVEAYRAGPAALEQAHRAESTLEGMLAECFARAPGGVPVPTLIVEAMMAGVAHVVRTRLNGCDGAQLSGLSDELVDWVLSYPGKPAASLAGLDVQTVWRNTALEPVSIFGNPDEKKAWPCPGDRGVMLSAAGELAVADSRSKLTVARIRSYAGVSRAIFSKHFDGAEDCLLAAVEQRASEALANAARAQTAGLTWAGGIYRAVAALCDQVSGDPLLARTCLSDDLAPGLRGARLRQRLISSVAELLVESIPLEHRPGPLAEEASMGAAWGLFLRHVIGDKAQRREIAASLSFLLLAPAIGGAATVTAIRREQEA